MAPHHAALPVPAKGRLPTVLSHPSRDLGLSLEDTGSVHHTPWTQSMVPRQLIHREAASPQMPRGIHMEKDQVKHAGHGTFAKAPPGFLQNNPQFGARVK